MRKKLIAAVLALPFFVLGGDTFGQYEEPQTAPEPTPGAASADPTVPETGDDEGDIQDYGLSLSVGGGVMGFTDSTMRDTADVGGLWDVRVGFLTNLWVGVELAYEGGLQNIDALGLDTSARLLSTSLEGNLRVNFTHGEIWQPYVFAGAAWKRYDLTNVDVNTSSVEDSDDVLEIPLGVGIGYRLSGFLVDVRGSFRPALDADLVPTTGGDDADMHSWQAAARLGYAF